MLLRICCRLCLQIALAVPALLTSMSFLTSWTRSLPGQLHGATEICWICNAKACNFTKLSRHLLESKAAFLILVGLRPRQCTGQVSVGVLLSCFFLLPLLSGAFCLSCYSSLARSFRGSFKPTSRRDPSLLPRMSQTLLPFTGTESRGWPCCSSKAFGPPGPARPSKSAECQVGPSKREALSSIACHLRRANSDLASGLCRAW